MDIFKAALLVFCLHILSCNANADSIEFSEEVEIILKSKRSLLASIVESPSILSNLREANASRSAVTADEISALEKKWIDPQTGPKIVESLMTNDCAQHLLQFRDKFPFFPEIFVTDKHGLNICQTNRTSDYYQADEHWWQNSFNGGTGKASHGGIEYDESAKSRGIALYVPVQDPSNKEVLGVVKAVLDFDSIIEAL